MPRIPDSELQRLKREVSLAVLCRDYGVELKPMGPDNLMGRCPFHEDQTPSFGVTPSKNLWNCLAGCGGGDNIQFVMRREKVSFRHAVEILQRKTGVTPAAPVLKTRQGTEHPVLVDPATALADHALLKHVADFYHQTFLNDPKAMKYLEQRKCFHPEAVKLFRLGYANRTLGYRVPATTAEGRKLKAQLQRLGILRESGHEHLTGSVVFPILDAQGGIAQMYGRKITPNLREGTPLHMYLPGEHKAVWNGPALAGQKEWLLCEALIDALTLWCAGYRNVTAAYGVNSFTPAHWALLEEMKPERVVICYDNDEAGNTATAKLAEQLKAKGVRVVRAKLPPGKDINDVARENKHAQAALASVLEGAGVRLAARPAEKPAVAAPAPAPEAAPPGAVGAGPACHVAMVVDEMTGEPLPIVDRESLETGIGWAPEPFTPAPYAEVQAQQAASPPPLPASAPLPSLVAPVEPEQPEPTPANGDEASFTFGERQWRVRGVAKNLSFETLRVQLRVLSGESYHLDTLDLCNAKHRQNFLAQAHGETGQAADALKRDLGQVLLKVEELQEQHIRKTVEPERKEIVLKDSEREAALALLRDPKLLDRILADFERCGVVGEQTNTLVGYLAAVSRKLDDPLAIIVQSTSAAGKSALMDAVLAFVPEEQRIKYSAMTGQSLYYLGDCDLQHKVLAIVEEEGAERASYALKLLQSEGELTIASTGKDPQSGRMVTQEYHVEGPVMIMLTTTAIDIDEELLNRCIVLTVDESREQTRRIHELQREARTLAGLRRKLDKAAILAAHRNAQRLLRPLRVMNDYARRLTFLDDRTRTRRDHEKYLTLIDTIAFLHQYQRPLKRDGAQLEYIEVTLDDIATANRLAGEVLGRSLDELPPQTRRLLWLIDELVGQECKRLKLARADYHFTRRDVRQHTGWTDFQVRVHLDRLMQMEYVLSHRGRRGQCFVYELLYDGQGQDGKPFLIGLLDAESLRTATVPKPSQAEKNEGVNGKLEGANPKFEGPLSGQSAPIAPPTSPSQNATSSNNGGASGKVEPSRPQNTQPGRGKKPGAS
jgi:DNA primase catalytic core